MDAPRKRPRQLRAKETVEVVLEAAAQMFDTEGLATTTNRIAQRAGVSIGSLYQYFPNKQVLLHALAERHVRDAQAQLDPVFRRLRDERPPFEESMRAILQVLVDLHTDRPGLHRLLHRVMPSVPADLAAMRAFEDHIAQEVADVLDRCGRGGEDALLTAQTVVHGVDAHLHRVMAQRKISVAPLVELVDRLAPNTSAL